MQPVTAPVASLSAIAAHLNFIRETGGPNRGHWVGYIQRQAGGSDGDSWCAEFICLVLQVAYSGVSPLPTTGSCQRMLDAASAKGWVVTTPQVDDLFFYVNDVGRAHHVGIVTGVDPLTGIAGNTSPDGLSDNGTGVFDHPISAHVFVRLPK